jgi:hypothetical protein
MRSGGTTACEICPPGHQLHPVTVGIGSSVKMLESEMLTLVKTSFVNA